MDKKRNLEGELVKVESQLKMKQGPDNILKLKKIKIRILMKLAQYEAVIGAGFLFLGSEGPDLLVFRHILAAYCHEKKYQEALDLLEKWNKNYKSDGMKFREMRDSVLRIKASSVLNVGSLNSEIIYEALEIQDAPALDEATTENKVWRYRPPPIQSATYFLCPRITELGQCLFGDKCLAAHSKEELEDWKATSKVVTSRSSSTLCSSTNTVTHAASSPPPRFASYRELFHSDTGITWVPPPNTPYLNQLITNFARESSDFWQSVDGVKLMWSHPPKTQVPPVGEHVWTVFIRSQRRDTLRTVSLLHDCNRGNFRISEAYFCENGSFSQPINLMESNICNHKNSAKLQVLSTFIPPRCLNRSCFYYRIGFTFHASCAGQFSQTIVFDFKEKPTLVQELVGEVEVAVAADPEVSSAHAYLPPPPRSTAVIAAEPPTRGVPDYSILSRFSISVSNQEGTNSRLKTFTTLPSVLNTPSSEFSIASSVVQQPATVSTDARLLVGNRPQSQGLTHYAQNGQGSCGQAFKRAIGTEREAAAAVLRGERVCAMSTPQPPPRPCAEYLDDADGSSHQFPFPDFHYIGKIMEEIINSDL